LIAYERGEEEVHGRWAREAREVIRHLELALAIADELEDGTTGYLIERALDEARARLFIPFDERTIDR
jgi:hypothetical protein